MGFRPTVGEDHPEPVSETVIAGPDGLLMKPLAVRTLVRLDVCRITSTEHAEYVILGIRRPGNNLLTASPGLSTQCTINGGGKAQVAPLAE